MIDSNCKLIFCDIYRDGGSLGAVLRQADGSVSLFLEIEPWDQPSESRVYGSLWVAEGEIPSRKGVKLEPASQDEKKWIELCKEAQPSRYLDDRSIKHFANFLDILMRRN